MSYLAHPDRATELEIESLDIFTHESMHVRGEMNEARTECEAVQRNYRAAKLLGVPDGTAKRNALDYYNITYQMRGKIGGMQGAYYSDQCAPGESHGRAFERFDLGDTIGPVRAGDVRRTMVMAMF